MHVLQHFVDCNASQRKRFYPTKKCCVLLTQPQTPKRRLRLIRKQIETICIFPQRRRRTRPIAAAHDRLKKICESSCRRDSVFRCLTVIKFVTYSLSGRQCSMSSSVGTPVPLIELVSLEYQSGQA